MKRSSRGKTRTERQDASKELNQYYLKEILRNIENIQTTILKKLNTSHTHQDHSTEKTLPHTPSRR